MANELQEKLDAILEDKNKNLLPGNIKKNHTCLSIEGTHGITNNEQYQTCNRLSNKILSNHQARYYDSEYINKYELLDYIESTGEQYIQLGSLGSGSARQYDIEIIGQFTDLDYPVQNDDGSENPWHLIGVGARATSAATIKMFYVGWSERTNTWYYSLSGKTDCNTGVKCDDSIHSFLLANYGELSGIKGFFLDGELIGEEYNTVSSTSKYSYDFGMFGYENKSGTQRCKFRLYRS